MNWESEDFKDHRKDQQARRAKRLPGRQQAVWELAAIGYFVEKLTEYQFRITKPGSLKRVDIFPIHLRYHNITDNRRGQIKGMDGMIPLLEDIFK
ncbi:MAG: hypothetical protein V3W20_11435 [Candidatus Neomarinimicrobiota bacterium]